MFPSSTKDSSKLCCERSTCSKHRKKNSPTSSIEEIHKDKAHKETQMSVATTSSSEKNNVPAKTSEKSSEAHFDRNNQNIKNCKFCPSNSSKSSQLCSVVLRCPSTVVCNTTDVSRHHSSHIAQSGFKATHKCTCNKLGISSSSSSSSLTSEHFPVKKKLNSDEKNIYARRAKRHLPQQVNIPPPPRPERLQPNLFRKCPDSFHDDFYSCSSSEDSECNEMPTESPCYSMAPKMDKNFVILELLHEVVHLINKDNPIREEAMRITQVAPSSIDVNCSKTATQNKALIPTVCPHHHCFYCSAQVPPFNYPTTLTYPTGDVLPIPQPFVYEESFKDCSSILSCICSNITEVCPKHGPLKMILQKLDFPCQREIQQDIVCEQAPSAKSVRVDDKCSSEMEISVDSCDCSAACLIEYNENDTNVSNPVLEIVEQTGSFENFEICEPCLDCLMEYDDEEPTPPGLRAYGSTPQNNITTVELPIVKFGGNKETESPNEAGIATVEKYKEGESPTAKGITTVGIIIEVTESNTELGESSPNVRKEMNVTEETRLANIVDNVPNNQRYDSNYYEKDIDLLDNDENELAKEKLAESRKRKDRDDETNNAMVLATINQNEDKGPPEEMKFFIDSLIVDLDAMGYARRKSEFEKNICKSNLGLCTRQSFPVTITNISDLGANSLYVQWKIHDCCGIGGYEIYTDGYLTNRYYNGRHEAAVITNVDVTVPHKVALVAQPSANSECMEQMCGDMTKENNKPKSLQWKTVAEKERDSYSELWTPSIFLYDPVICKATTVPQLIRDNF